MTSAANPFARALVRADNWMSWASEYLCIFMTVVIVVLVLLQIAARYVLHAPLAWTEEAARYCVVWAGLLGTTLSFRYGYDVMLFQRPRTQNKPQDIFIRLIHFLSVAAFLGPVLWYAPGFIDRQFARTSEILEIPGGYVTAVVPIFAFIILYHALVMLLFYDRNEGRSDPHAEI